MMVRLKSRLLGRPVGAFWIKNFFLLVIPRYDLIMDDMHKFHLFSLCGLMVQFTSIRC